MAIINYTDQLKYTGKGYLDAKMMPVKSVSDLKSIPRTQRFEGLTITVLNDGEPMDYWLVGGTSDSNWVKKSLDTTKVENMVADEAFARAEADKSIKSDIASLSERLKNLSESTMQAISANTESIKTLSEKVDTLIEKGCTPDDVTIGKNPDNDDKLYVKILNKEGNILMQDTNDNNETGLYVGIPCFMEDEELM